VEKKKKDKLLTIKQVATRLKMDYSHIYRMIRAGVLPCIKVGIGRGVIRIKESDLEAYIERKGNVTTQTD
jgi:excisionase family DNA binding protein